VVPARQTTVLREYPDGAGTGLSAYARVISVLTIGCREYDPRGVTIR
jgi:hypothetical protein